MYKSRLIQFVSAGALAAAIAVVPATLPATAQVVVAEDIYEDDTFDWDWLGLLGLLGLAGLAGKNRSEDSTHQNSNAYRNNTPTPIYRDPSTRRTDATVYRDPNAPDSRNR